MTVLGGIDRRLLQNVDWPLLGAMGGLVVLSATTLASLHIGRAGGNVAFRQLAWFALGLCALVVVASIDYRRLVRLAPLFFVFGLLGLASVFVMGRTVSGGVAALFRKLGFRVGAGTRRPVRRSTVGAGRR